MQYWYDGINGITQVASAADASAESSGVQMHSRDRLVSACMVKSRPVTRGQFVVQTDGPSGQLAVDQFLEHLVRPLSTRAPAPSPAPASLRAGSHVTVDVRLLLLIQYIALVAYEICVSYVLSIKYQNKHISLVESPLYIDRRVTQISGDNLIVCRTFKRAQLCINFAYRIRRPLCNVA